MFVPFNSAMAQRMTNQADLERQREQASLCDAYLQIIHVHIQRACHRNWTKTSVYIPSEVASIVTDTLRESGFVIERITSQNSAFPTKTNYYIISWEEG